jgi:hypothetical protein
LTEARPPFPDVSADLILPGNFLSSDFRVTGSDPTSLSERRSRNMPGEYAKTITPEVETDVASGICAGTDVPSAVLDAMRALVGAFQTETERMVGETAAELERAVVERTALEFETAVLRDRIDAQARELDDLGAAGGGAGREASAGRCSA